MRPSTRLESFRASDFRDTSSRQFHRPSQIKVKLVRKRPLGIVCDRRFNDASLIFRISFEKRRADEAPKILDNVFLLFRVEKVKAPQEEPVNRPLSFRSRSRYR